jgi:predicted proteasome-type protease
MLSNLSVGMPIDLLCYARDSLEVTMKRRFDKGDPYFEALTRQWLDGTRKVFKELPPLEWQRASCGHSLIAASFRRSGPLICRNRRRGRPWRRA